MVRHGKALGDALTDEGIALQREMSIRLKSRGISPEQIYTSPLGRAQQTAHILAETLGSEVTIEPALDSATFDDEALLRLIGKSTLFVGHDPTVAAFVNRLVGKQVFSGMVKSSAAIIDFAEKIAWGSGKLVAYLQPIG